MNPVFGTQTEKNLQKAFAGESQAQNRYIHFAQQARREGLMEIATMFEDTASTRKSHAERFLDFLESKMNEITANHTDVELSNTLENLYMAIKIENSDGATVYPEFAQTAEEEGFQQIAKIFRAIANVEKQHLEHYSTLFHSLAEGKTFERENRFIWKCHVCGMLHESKRPPRKFPLPDHAQAFLEIFSGNY